jgi:hypothetical protein
MSPPYNFRGDFVGEDLLVGDAATARRCSRLRSLR